MSDLFYKVTDYDIAFDTGAALQITIDPTHGDHLDTSDQTMTFHLGAKPSKSDSRRMVPPETISVHREHVLFTRVSEREVSTLTPEVKEAWDAVLKQAIQ